jgi:hypothetical protein
MASPLRCPTVGPTEGPSRGPCQGSPQKGPIHEVKSKVPPPGIPLQWSPPGGTLHGLPSVGSTPGSLLQVSHTGVHLHEFPQRGPLQGTQFRVAVQVVPSNWSNPVDPLHWDTSWCPHKWFPFPESPHGVSFQQFPSRRYPLLGPVQTVPSRGTPCLSPAGAHTKGSPPGFAYRGSLTGCPIMVVPSRWSPAGSPHQRSPLQLVNFSGRPLNCHLQFVPAGGYLQGVSFMVFPPSGPFQQVPSRCPIHGVPSRTAFKESPIGVRPGGTFQWVPSMGSQTGNHTGVPLQGVPSKEVPPGCIIQGVHSRWSLQMDPNKVPSVSSHPVLAVQTAPPVGSLQGIKSWVSLQVVTSTWSPLLVPLQGGPPVVTFHSFPTRRFPPGVPFKWVPSRGSHKVVPLQGDPSMECPLRSPVQWVPFGGYL